jgi:hypothetical protein
MRRLLVVLFLLLACATPAQAAPRALGPAPDAFALAGESVLALNATERTLTVDALPQGRVFSYDAPAGSAPFGRLAASPRRAALTLSLRDDTSDFAAAQVFSGPALGPWAPLTPMNRLSENFVLPWQHQVEGERVFTSEIRGSLENNVVVVRDPEARDLALPYTAVFAGDLVAYTELAPGQEPDAIGARLVVAEWRTGFRRGVTDLPEPIEHLALRPDGRVALTLADSGGIFEVRPGTAPRRVFRRATGYDEPLAFAGEHLVFAEYGQLRVLDPSGKVRAFGTPTEEFGDFVTDDRRVLWTANDCLLIADVTAPAAPAPAAGPCPRTEIALDDSGPNPNLRRTLPVTLWCVAAPARCRGTLKVRLGLGRTVLNRPTRYRIRAGQRRRIVVRLTERGYRVLRKEVARERGALVRVTPRGDDGDTTWDDFLVLPRGAS